jgi:hypothetical protein
MELKVRAGMEFCRMRTLSTVPSSFEDRNGGEWMLKIIDMEEPDVLIIKLLFALLTIFNSCFTAMRR